MVLPASAINARTSKGGLHTSTLIGPLSRNRTKRERSMTRKTSLLVTAFAFAGLLTPARANHGLTRFVSTDGIDSGDCLTNPCRTIQFAVDTANPGDVIWVRPGTYNENLMITKPNLTLQGSGASSTIISGDRTANVVTVFGVTSFTIERFTVRNAGKSGTVPGSAAIHGPHPEQLDREQRFHGHYQHRSSPRDRSE